MPNRRGCIGEKVDPWEGSPGVGICRRVGAEGVFGEEIPPWISGGICMQARGGG